jgi:hypothetical protein
MEQRTNAWERQEECMGQGIKEKGLMIGRK